MPRPLASPCVASPRVLLLCVFQKCNDIFGCRVFYLIDVESPIRKEIQLHPKDKVHPPDYIQKRLPPSLSAQHFHNTQLRNGTYRRVFF